LADHIFGAIGAAILAVLGAVALGAHLAASRAAHLGLVAMVVTVMGHCLSLVIAGVATSREFRRRWRSRSRRP
jgi:hypothetical protein